MGKKLFPRAERARKQTADNGDARQSGTARANYRDSPSCERASGWGGARNRADRVSDALTDMQVAGILDAAAFAIATGRTFQRHWIVHYGNAGISERDGARFVSRLLSMINKQARREGGAMTAIWVRERASDKGEHVHILLHLPAGMRLHGRTRRWIEAAGGICGTGVGRVRIIGGRLPKIGEFTGGHYAVNAANVARYLLKSASDETGQRIGLSRSGRGGRIVGKRCGWTQNIGKAARGAQ